MSVRKKLILVHSSCNPQKVARIFSGVKWTFFDLNYASRQKWLDALGRTGYIDSKEDLVAVSYAMRDEFIQWSADLGKPFWDKWYWWVTRLATRNNLISKFYRYVCYLQVLKNLLEKTPQAIIVVSDSFELLESIRVNWKEAVSIRIPLFFTQFFSRIWAYVWAGGHFVLSWGKFFKNSILEIAAARLTYSVPKKDHVFSQDHIVIHTCVDDACFGESGKFKDRYFPGLADHLRREGKKVSTLIWLYNVKKTGLLATFRWFRDSRDSFLIPQDYFNIFDYVYSFFIVIKSASFDLSGKGRFFRGLDLFTLIKHEQFLQARETGVAYFVNQIKMFGNWKKAGFYLTYYVDTWELRNCEVPAIIGIRKDYPGCRVIGFQHAALIPRLLFFNYKTTPEEFKASKRPDIGLANSNMNRDFLLREGFDSSFVKVGPALRYFWLKKYLGPGNGAGTRKGILVCLSLVPDIALEMLEYVYLAFCESPEIEIKIKAHPMFGFQKIRKRLSFTLPPHFRIAEGNMEEQLKNSKAVIVSQSAAMVDSVFLGIPTVIIGQHDALDIVPLDMFEPKHWGSDKKIWEVVYSPAQLRDAVSRLSSNVDCAPPKAAKEFFEFDMVLLNKYFTQEEKR